MLKHLGPIVATAVVVLFLLVSALPLMHWFEAEGRSAALAGGRALWAEHRIDNYRITLEMRCDCGDIAGRPLRVTVRNGVASTNDALAPGTGIGDLPATVPQLFDVVDTAVADAPDELVVTYDELYGFPAEIRIDPDNRVTGDETVVLASAFDPRPLD